VKDRYPDAPYRPARGTRFTVEVEFHLVASRLFIQPHQPVPPDLDNLLKPVLDTLFISDNVKGPTGVLVPENDTFVTEVRARKTEAPVPEEQGADIFVTWEE
jgi:Holliday junction resolvase RusA-like endonuclease